MTFKEMWREVPKPLKIMVYTVLGIIGAIVFGLLFGIIVRELWNWLMPMIFGLPAITFWQGVGIVILAKILFGGFSSHNDSSKPSKSCRRESYEKRWEADGMKAGFEKWRHYDEWWESEGEAAFTRYAEEAREDSQPAEPKQDAQPGEPPKDV